jgi:hypothetical protein
VGLLPDAQPIYLVLVPRTEDARRCRRPRPLNSLVTKPATPPRRPGGRPRRSFSPHPPARGPGGGGRPARACLSDHASSCSAWCSCSSSSSLSAPP